VFIAFGLWTLHPDSLDEDPKIHPSGAFVTTTIAFFIAEMGDKTQLATIALGARFDGAALLGRHRHDAGHDAGQRARGAHRRNAGQSACRLQMIRWIAAGAVHPDGHRDHCLAVLAGESFSRCAEHLRAHGGASFR
jgi:hypothetical protein